MHSNVYQLKPVPAPAPERDRGGRFAIVEQASGCPTCYQRTGSARAGRFIFAWCRAHRVLWLENLCHYPNATPDETQRVAKIAGACRMVHGLMQGSWGFWNGLPDNYQLAADSDAWLMADMLAERAAERWGRVDAVAAALLAEAVELAADGAVV